jgi:excisionase family DNA binding protein
MLKEYEHEKLWETVSFLTENHRLDEAKTLFKVIVEKTFSALKQPADFLNTVAIEIPSAELIFKMRDIDNEIKEHLQLHDIETASKCFLDYIDRLSEFTTVSDKKQIQKQIIATLLARDYIKKIKDEQDFAGIFSDKDVEYFSPKQVGEKLGISDQTVRRMCDKGKFPEAIKTIGGHWRIPRNYFTTTKDQDLKAETIMKEIDKKNREVGDADEFNLI